MISIINIFFINWHNLLIDVGRGRIRFFNCEGMAKLRWKKRRCDAIGQHRSTFVNICQHRNSFVFSFRFLWWDESRKSWTGSESTFSLFSDKLWFFRLVEREIWPPRKGSVTVNLAQIRKGRTETQVVRTINLAHVRLDAQLRDIRRLGEEKLSGIIGAFYPVIRGSNRTARKIFFRGFKPRRFFYFAPSIALISVFLPHRWRC